MPKKPNWKKARVSKKKIVSKACEKEIFDYTAPLEEVAVAKLSTILGNFHQGHSQFGDNSGKQCVCNSSSAICYAWIKQVGLWTGEDLDCVLRAGDELYSKVKPDLRPGEVYVLINELPTVLNLFNRTFSITLSSPIAGLMFGKMDADMESEFAMPLDKALGTMLCKFNSCFVTFMESTFAIIYCSKIYHIFDSHSRNASGVSAAYGTSVLVKYAHISGVYNHCLQLGKSMNAGEYDMYEITGIRLTNDIDNTDVSQLSTQQLDICITDFSQEQRSMQRDTCVTDILQKQPSRQEADICITNVTQEQASIKDDDICITGTSSKEYQYNPTSMEEKQKLCNMLGIKMEDNTQIIYNLSTGPLGKPCKTAAIVADGNCYFRAVSFALSGTEKNHRKIRLAVVKNLLEKAPMFVPYLRTPYTSMKEYIQKSKMKNLSTWATDVEIMSTADLLQIDIFTFTDRWLKYSSPPFQSIIKDSSSIYLHNPNDCHYEVVSCVKAGTSCCSHCCKSENILRRKLTEDDTPKQSVKKVCKGRRARNEKCRDNMRQKRNEQKKELKRSYANHQQEQEEWYREKDLKRRRVKYVTDELHKQMKKVCSTEKYAYDKDHKSKVKNHSKKKYRTDEQHRSEVINYNKEKYRTDEDYRSEIKSSSKEKYRTDEHHRREVINYNKEKYRTDEDYRSEIKSYSKEKYRFDEHHRSEVKAHIRHKYATNKIYKEKVKFGSVSRRQKRKSDRKCIDNVISGFKHMICEAPDHICTVCNRRLFRKQVITCKPHSYHLKGPDIKILADKCISTEYLHTCCTDCHSPCSLKDSAYSNLWICFTCHRKISSGKLPAEASQNNLRLIPIPPELACLNSLEQHLIAKHIPFAKIAALPKGGQRGVHGPVVCVPSDIDKTVSCLPRIESEDQMIRVKLKRKLTYKGHYKYQLVSTSKIKKALEYLKHHNDQYKDIQFNEDWVNPLPIDTVINMACADDVHDEDDTLPDLTVKENLGNSDVNIENKDDEDNTLPDLPEEDNMDNSDHQIDISHTGDNGMYMDSCLQPVDMGQEILDQQFDKILCVAPAEGNDPIKILMDKENEAKSFPVLFPSGSPTFHDAREARITIARYLHTRLMHADNRFAKNTEYIFYAQYLSEVYQVISSVSIALRKSHVPSLESKVTPNRLVDNDSLREMFKTDSGYKFLRPIRGTPSYWQSSQKDLFAMLRQLGIPTWFCSFSAGDTRWPEVLNALLKENNCEQTVEELDWSAKSELLRSNPVTAARMFEHRFQCFLKEVILSAANPVGKVIDYFYRVEFQHRGSPHVHCLLWVEDAPQLDKDTDEDVAAFIDKYVMCDTPDSDDEELYEIVTKVQRHSRFHSKSCRKKGTKCRFNFPRPPSKFTYISRPNKTDVSNKQSTDPAEGQGIPQLGKEITKEYARQILQKIWKALDSSDQPFRSIDDLFAEVGVNQELFQLAFDKLSQRASVVLQRDTEDVWINQYNKDLLLAWNANMDIQFVLDAYSCIVYIISYISKAEREMGLLLEQARKETLDGNEDAKQAMKKLGGVYLHSRELSAQEAVFRVCNLHLKECSRFVHFIPVGDAIKMSRPLKDLRNKSKGEDLNMEDIWMTSPVDRYKNRPSSTEFEDMSLATFCSEFRVLSKSEEPSKDCKKPNVYQLQNGLGYIRKRTRTKPAVIRYPRFSSEKQPEKYYQSMLQLYLPHRSDAQLKPDSFESHKDFHDSGAVKVGENDFLEMVNDIVLRNKSPFEKNADEIERAEDIMDKSEGMEDAWAQICPESELERISCEDQGVKKNLDPESNDDIPDLLDKEKRDHTIEIIQSKISQEEAKGLLRSLNIAQQQVFYRIRQWCLEKKNNKDSEPFYVFITGGAGTGKSHLIKSIFYEANRILVHALPNPDDISVLLTAPTGVAAFNIDAATIHSTFSINIEAKLPYQPLGEEKINKLRAKLENLQILIIDEISMVDHKLLAYIHGRLRQIKQCKDYSPFAKVSVIAVGDFYQLPPVKGKPLYSEEVGVDLWNDNFKLVELTEVMRQKDGSFADTLNRLRTRKKSEEILPDDTNLLRERETGEDWDEIHIFPTNAQVDLHNLRKLKAVCTDTITIDAQDFEKDAKSGKLKKRQSQFINVFRTNLARHLSLGIGARVLLTKNIDVSDGLVNGVFGTVSYIPQLKEDETYPTTIYVLFDHMKVGRKLRKQTQLSPSIPANSTPISPVEDRINNCGGLRRQFPLKLSFACTVHKVQGVTLDKAVVSLDKVFAPGQAYVALSRVTSIEGLTIQDYKDSAIYCNEKASGALSSMALFLPQSEYASEPKSKEGVCKVILHNIQSLSSHIEDVKKDERFKTSDIICLTETWLTANNNGEHMIDGFTFHHKTRIQCYDKDALNLRTMLHGGVGVFCKEGLRINVLDLEIRNLECLVLQSLEPNFVLAVMYRPPSYRLPVFRHALETLIENLDRLKDPCIVMGDFNEDALNNSTVCQLMAQHDFQQCVKQATTESGTLIDHVYIRGINLQEVQVTPTYFSYHEAITLML